MGQEYPCCQRRVFVDESQQVQNVSWGLKCSTVVSDWRVPTSLGEIAERRGRFRGWRLAQGAGRSCLSSALASTTSLRMIAVRATFGGLPRARSSGYLRAMSGLQRSAATAAV